MTKISRREIGEVGEARASNYLILKGFDIMETNIYNQHAPYDIIAEKDSVLYAINVKTASKLFGIRLANIPRLIKACADKNAILSFLLVDNNNYLFLTINDLHSSWEELTKKEIQCMDKMAAAKKAIDVSQNIMVYITPEEFTLDGYNYLEKEVKPHSTTASQTYLPVEWAGKKVAVILLDPPQRKQ